MTTLPVDAGGWAPCCMLPSLVTVTFDTVADPRQLHPGRLQTLAFCDECGARP